MMVPAIENTKADFLSGGAALAFTGAGISKDSDGLMMTSFKIFVAVCNSLQHTHIYTYVHTFTYLYTSEMFRNILLYYLCTLTYLFFIRASSDAFVKRRKVVCPLIAMAMAYGNATMPWRRVVERRCHGRPIFLCIISVYLEPK